MVLRCKIYSVQIKLNMPGESCGNETHLRVAENTI